VMKDFPGKPGKPLPLFQMSHELVHLLGASHTPVGMTITQMAWQILARPEYLEPLRKEAEAAVAKVGFTDRIVEFLPLQDSFIREANRLYPNNQGESNPVSYAIYLVNNICSGHTAYGGRRAIRLPGWTHTPSRDANCFSYGPLHA
jgi:cytochrome P450